ncbi:hypothetical protein IH992_03715 [Candidatus Poribacteria bacterium]|nr:hypothetical protein [Candidatus Poribacteria bacterium]
MQTSKIARIGQIPLWYFCAGLLVIIGCVVLQPQNRWAYSKDVTADTVVYVHVPADEITVHATKTGKKYHKGDCRYLEKSKVGTTVLEARQKGLTACKVCKPPN